MNIDPVSDYLIVKEVAAQHVNDVLITPFDEPRGPKYATVVAAGPGCVLPSGALAPMPCKVGDTVMLQINAGTEVRLGRDTYRFVPARDLFGVMHPAAPTEGTLG